MENTTPSEQEAVDSSPTTDGHGTAERYDPEVVLHLTS